MVISQRFSLHLADDLLSVPRYAAVLQEIEDVLRACPVFLFDGKSRSNPGLDVSQILMNRFIDSKLASAGWQYHPAIFPQTEDEDIGLRADFRKITAGTAFQVEVQFGNMSRWYSDVFKFQLSHLVGLTHIGISVVASQELANRIDSNIAYFDRCKRELQRIQTLLRLPILLLEVAPGAATDTGTAVNLRDCGFPILTTAEEPWIKYKTIAKKENSYRIINGVLTRTALTDINDESETGPMPTQHDSNDQD